MTNPDLDELVPIRVKRDLNREDAPCASDEHKFRPEVYEAAAGDAWVNDECCTICGWSWRDIDEHEVGLCCCPGDHGSAPAEEI